MANANPLKILLVDDEEIVHQTLTPYLTDCGHSVEGVRDGRSGLNSIEKNDYDLALIDIRMPGLTGFELLEKATALRPELSSVIITGHGNMDLAIKALRLGAADFLVKPVKLRELDAILEKSSRLRSLRRDKRRLKDTVRGIQVQDDRRARNRLLVGESRAMDELRAQIRLAVEANCDTILISGETGAGKEVVARELHFLGGKDDSPFIAVSCPAIPDSLIESELFGHMKGSFTGATEDRPGCFELADGGSLFLDEVSDLSPTAQAKLLRVLETRSLRRVGGTSEIKVNVRVIAATNVDLAKQVESGKFRQDLFYRLNVFAIKLHPLRERIEDIMPLAEHFLQAFALKSGFKIAGFSAEARDALLSYSYPGNARELRNMIERAAILCRSGLIEPRHLNIQEHRITLTTLKKQDNEPERSRVVSALEEHKWNRRAAAQTLGISYSSLRYKMKKLGLE